MAGARLRTKFCLVETKVFRPAVLLAETGEGAGTARGGIRRLAAGTDFRNRGEHPVELALVDDETRRAVDRFRRTAGAVGADGRSAGERLDVHRGEVVFIRRIEKQIRRGIKRRQFFNAFRAPNADDAARQLRDLRFRKPDENDGKLVFRKFFSQPKKIRKPFFRAPDARATERDEALAQTVFFADGVPVRLRGKRLRVRPVVDADDFFVSEKRFSDFARKPVRDGNERQVFDGRKQFALPLPVFAGTEQWAPSGV